MQRVSTPVSIASSPACVPCAADYTPYGPRRIDNNCTAPGRVIRTRRMQEQVSGLVACSAMKQQHGSINISCRTVFTLNAIRN
jgi:hypothetical protein